MKIIKNSGNDRVVDALRESLVSHSALDVTSSAFSLFAFGEAWQISLKQRVLENVRNL